jgi:hypothetical protein
MEKFDIGDTIISWVYVDFGLQEQEIIKGFVGEIFCRMDKVESYYILGKEDKGGLGEDTCMLTRLVLTEKTKEWEWKFY